MGGAASVLESGRGRALALAGLAAALVLYGASAERLWDLSSRWELAVVSLLVLPAFMAAVWLALPFGRTGRPTLVLGVAALAAGALWASLELAGLESVANVSRFACFVLIGLWFVSLFEELWWIALVAVLVPWADIWSVAAGPTNYVLEEQPGFFERLSVGFALPGGDGSVHLGPPDVIFFALFLSAADRFRLRVGWTWLAMTGFLALTLVIVWAFDTGLPALPAICLGLVLPNADLLWRDARREWRAYREARANPR